MMVTYLAECWELGIPKHKELFAEEIVHFMLCEGIKNTFPNTVPGNYYFILIDCPKRNQKFILSMVFTFWFFFILFIQKLFSSTRQFSWTKIVNKSKYYSWKWLKSTSCINFFLIIQELVSTGDFNGIIQRLDFHRGQIWKNILQMMLTWMHGFKTMTNTFWLSHWKCLLGSKRQYSW